MNKANECTCPSGDGSLVHPCPAHPAEQAGGDERAAFELFVRKHCGMPAHIAVNWDAKFTNDAWEGWQARAALAQPSPPPHPAPELDFSRPLETENGDPVKWICADVIEYKSARVCVAKDTGLVYSSPYIGLKIRNVMPEHAEAERPEVVARVVHSNPVVLGQCGPLNANDELMTVAQHAASVARWAEMFNRVEQQRDAALVEVERLRESKGDPVGSLEKCMKVMYERDEHAKRLEAAMARVAELESKLAELEKQEPVALANRGNQCFWVKWTEAAAGLYGPGIKLYAAPVAQAQQLNGLDKQCRDDVARALGLRPNQERGFAWSYLLASIKSCVKASGDSAQAQHSVPIAPQLKRALGLVVAALEADGDRPTSKYALSELKKVLAAAPGKEVPQAWIDVQAERRRQVEAEGWTPEHDDLYCAAELPRAAAAYILNGANDEAPAIWPFVAKWWKPRDARSNYVRASALILAEIERLDRAGISQSPQPGATTASS
ncbi:hypothetical protein ACIUZN_01060 [Pseudomonas aeruginosa]